MNAIRLGLFQESADRFAFAVHADTTPARSYQEFSARDLRAALVQRPEGKSVQVLTAPAEVAQAGAMVFDADARDPESVVTGGVMALETFSDWWNMTVLRDSTPGYHVALAFSTFYPLRVSFGEGNLMYVAYEAAEQRDTDPAWYMLQPSLVEQTAAIVFPDAPTSADACALLANRPGVVDYLMALGDTFSLSDIEQLARFHQLTPSIVVALAEGIRREDRSWLYRVKLSERAVASAGLLAVSYARAKARRIAGLRSRTPPNLSADKLRYREAQINRFGHHLALLELCVGYGIGLWSCPMSANRDEALDDEIDAAGDQWSVAVKPE
jgi:hypothetical protein